MLVDDLATATKSVVRELKSVGIKNYRLTLWADENRKQISAKIDAKECKKETWLPYVVILVLGIVFIWGMLECPGCRASRMCRHESVCVGEGTNRLDFGLISQTNIWSCSIEEKSSLINKVE